MTKPEQVRMLKENAETMFDVCMRTAVRCRSTLVEVDEKVEHFNPVLKSTPVYLELLQLKEEAESCYEESLDQVKRAYAVFYRLEDLEKEQRS